MKNPKPVGFSHNWSKVIRAGVFLLLPPAFAVLLYIMSLTGTSWAVFTCRIQISYTIVVASSQVEEKLLDKQGIETTQKRIDTGTEPTGAVLETEGLTGAVLGSIEFTEDVWNSTEPTEQIVEPVGAVEEPKEPSKDSIEVTQPQKPAESSDEPDTMEP